MRCRRRSYLMAIAMASTSVLFAQIDDDHTITDSGGRTFLRPNSYSPVPPSTFAVGTVPTSGYALDVHGEQMNPPLGDVFKTDAPGHIDTYWRMFHMAREFGNLFHVDQSKDFNINATRGYLRFHTNTIDRMRLTPTLTGQTVNGYTGLDLSGHLGVGPLMTVPPVAYIHINRNGSLFTGYRPWMLIGTYMSEFSDGMYVGMKNGGIDRVDAVINWSDNKEALPPYGPDALRFIFTRMPDGSSTASTTDGLEIARVIPAPNGNEGYFGFGDYFTSGIQPNERVDILDGRLRIRQLPDDPETDQPYKVMVVDDSNDPLERGVVKWKNIGGLGDCDWQMQANNDVCSVYNGSACPWNYDNFVGVGMQHPKAKLQVEYDGSGPNWGGDVTRSTLISTINGGRAVTGEARTPLSTQFANTTFTGVAGYASNAKYANGVVGNASIFMSSASTAVDVIGVSGKAMAYQNSQRTVGVYGTASGATGGNDWAAWFDGKGFLGVGPWVYSDESLKQDIADLALPETVNGLMQLHPKSYTFNTTDYPYLHLPTELQLGLISQEVETVFPQLVEDVIRPAQVDSLGIIVEPELAFKAMNYQGLIPVLIVGFQAQQQQLDQQQATIAQLQAQIDQCCAANPGMTPQDGAAPIHGMLPSELQEQRLVIQPNPFTDHTTLGYYVPQAGKVSLQVSTSDGKPLGILREEQAEAGAYTYEWNTSKLATGTYFCTFMLDGAVVVKRAVKVAR